MNGDNIDDYDNTGYDFDMLNYSSILMLTHAKAVRVYKRFSGELILGRANVAIVDQGDSFSICWGYGKDEQHRASYDKHRYSYAVLPYEKNCETCKWFDGKRCECKESKRFDERVSHKNYCEQHCSE